MRFADRLSPSGRMLLGPTLAFATSVLEKPKPRRTRARSPRPRVFDAEAIRTDPASLSLVVNTQYGLDEAATRGFRLLELGGVHSPAFLDDVATIQKAASDLRRDLMRSGLIVQAYDRAQLMPLDEALVDRRRACGFPQANPDGRFARGPRKHVEVILSPADRSSYELGLRMPSMWEPYFSSEPRVDLREVDGAIVLDVHGPRPGLVDAVVANIKATLDANNFRGTVSDRAAAAGTRAMNGLRAALV